MTTTLLILQTQVQGVDQIHVAASPIDVIAEIADAKVNLRPARFTTDSFEQARRIAIYPDAIIAVMEAKVP